MPACHDARQDSLTPLPKHHGRSKATQPQVLVYWGITPELPWIFVTGGGFHLPVRASDFGA